MSDYLAHVKSADDVFDVIATLLSLYDADDDGFDRDDLKAEFLKWASREPVKPMSGQWEKLAYAILNYVPEPQRSDLRKQLADVND